MNRSFDDRVADGLDEIAERASVSTTAWADIVRRLDDPVEEPDTLMIALSSRSQPDDEAAPNSTAPERSVTQMLLVAAVTGAVLVGGISLLPQNSDDQLTAPGAAPATDDLPASPVRELPPPGGVVESATYQTSLLGVPVTFTTNEPFVLGRARLGHFRLLSRNVQSNPKNDRAIIVARVGGWSTREQATDIDFRGTGSIDPYDVDTWAATNDVIVDNRATTTVDGRPTTVLDVRVDPDSTIHQDSCWFSSDGGRPEQGDRVDWNPCFWYKSLSAEFDPASGVRADLHDRMVGLSKSRFWIIEVQGADPIVIEAAAPLDDTTFFDEVASTVVATFSVDAADASEPPVTTEPPSQSSDAAGTPHQREEETN